jgi:hypothetical protein
MTDRLAELSAAGVAVWLDDLSRVRLTSGSLDKMRREQHVVGVTSNPTIFAKALADADAYDAQVRDLGIQGVTVEEAVRLLTGFDVRWACDVMRPAYDASGGEPKVILIGTGSELQYCFTAQERLEEQGTPTRVVSMPCQEWFFEQDTAYQQRVLPRGVKARVTVEAGVRMSWDRILGETGEPVSIEHYGASAPAKILFEQFGFTADNVVAKANAALAKVGEITGHTTGN